MNLRSNRLFFIVVLQVNAMNSANSPNLITLTSLMFLLRFISFHLGAAKVKV